jgi:hypothetical protein
MNFYLQKIYEESEERGYTYDKNKLGNDSGWSKIATTNGQLLYEWKHFQTKVRIRNQQRYRRIINILLPDPHPLFKIVSGPIETWEKVKE